MISVKILTICIKIHNSFRENSAHFPIPDSRFPTPDSRSPPGRG
ncbi:hypothetical protein [Moorena sp. SIO3A2]|nr:hypothetical protein [Moorena sp. SIO3A2]